jgi:hypothetical protein
MKRMNSRTWKVLGTTLSLTTLIIGFQNCGKGFQSVSMNEQSGNSSSSAGDGINRGERKPKLHPRSSRRSLCADL